MCLHASSELARRDKIKVAHRVIKDQGKNVFEDTTSSDLSLALVERIKRGK
jgi:hypothetical protein